MLLPPSLGIPGLFISRLTLFVAIFFDFNLLLNESSISFVNNEVLEAQLQRQQKLSLFQADGDCWEPFLLLL
jgi:hypothetical protein